MRILIVILLTVVSLVSFAGISPEKKSVLPKKLSEKERIEFEYSFIEALKYKITGNYKNAVLWFGNCLKTDPNSAVVRYELANIYTINGEYDSALQLIREAVKLNSHNLWYKISLADVLVKKSMILSACDVFDDIYENNPEKIEFLYRQVQLYSSVEKWNMALKVYDRIEKKEGFSENISLGKFNMYLKAGKINKAKKEIKQLVRKCPDKSDYLGLLANLYIDKNNSERALKVFDKMLEYNPDNGYVHFYLADYYGEAGDELKCKEHILKALRSSNTDIDIKLQYVYKMLTANVNFTDNEIFIKSIINTLLTTYPEEPKVLLLYTDYLLACNNLSEARETILKVLKYDRYNEAVWSKLLMINSSLNDIKALDNDSDEALKYIPDKPFPYLSKALVLLNDENYEAAIEYLEKGLKLTTDEDAENRFMFFTYLAECYYNVGEKEKSFKMFDNALMINGNNPGVLNNYSYYLALENKNLDKAEKLIAACIKIEGNEPTYLDTYAYVLYKRGKYSMARFFIKKALEKSPNEAVYWEHFGDIEYKDGNKEKALKYWKQSKEFGGKGESLDKKIQTGKLSE